ncbi:MAG TPA: DUF2835 domain-containing protein [Gammaproteobacteria bacterium]|nr:DUF2835 domain-containing protein [Gammaproteobacteria bacterium]
MAGRIRFFLEISAEEYLHYYRGAAQNVATTAVDGRRVRFPASVLRPFVTSQGVHGEFLLHYDDHNRFIRLERIGDLPGR